MIYYIYISLGKDLSLKLTIFLPDIHNTIHVSGINVSLKTSVFIHHIYPCHYSTITFRSISKQLNKPRKTGRGDMLPHCA